MISSALLRPQNLAADENPSVFDLAAAYAFGIIKNHPFVDGNKRTGFLASYIFLVLNGWELMASEIDADNKELIDALEDLDDVQNVYTSAVLQLDEDIAQRLLISASVFSQESLLCLN